MKIYQIDSSARKDGDGTHKDTQMPSPEFRFSPTPEVLKTQEPDETVRILPRTDS